MLGGGATNLEVRVDGDVDGYDRAMQQAQRATQGYERSLEKLGSDLARLEKQLDDKAAKRLQVQHDAYEKVGRGMVVAGGAMLIGAGLSAKAAMDWESAWAGVEKTVDGNVQQMDALEGQMRGLTRILPASHEEIAAVAEAAGQLGVERGSIVAFTKTMVDLGETTNLSADEAATSLARFMNIMQTAPGDVGRVGAALVDLGNKGASTEAEIMALGLRLAGAGRIAGMSEGEVLGIANALSSLGINAEAGGSAVSSMILKWGAAVENGGRDLEELADVAGMSAEEFANLWNSDSAQALNALVSGLQRIDESGGSVTQTLATLEVTEIRQRDAMLRLVGGGDLLTQALRDGNTAWAENSALLEEAAKRYETTEAKVQIARNQLNDAAITIGQSLLPAVAAGASGFSDLLQGIAMLPGPLKAVMGPLLALTGLVALAGGAFLLAAPKVAAFNAALASGNLSSGMQRMGGALQSTIGFLGGPWGAALGVGVTALGIFAVEQGQAAREVEALTATLDEQTGALTELSSEWAIKKLIDEGAFDSAEKLGIDLGLVTDAALGQADALERLREALAGVAEVENTDRAAVTGEEAADLIARANAAEHLADVIAGVGDTVDASQDKWRQQKEALEGSSVAQDEAADAAKKGAGAQGELGAEVDSTTTSMEEEKTAAEELKDALHSLNDAILGSRAGARAYQQTLDDSRRTLRQGARTLDIHTKAGRENQAALDDIAAETLRWADAMVEVDSSGRKSFQVMRQGRKDLYATARMFGLSEKEAHAYVNRVLGIPREWRTQFSTPGVDKAQGEAEKMRTRVYQVPRNWQTRFEAQTAAALQNVWGFVFGANRALDSINNETVQLTIIEHHQMKWSNGGREAPRLAGGGPVVGPGGPQADGVALWGSNGEHMWTARETTAVGGHGPMRALRQAALSGELRNRALRVELNTVSRQTPPPVVVAAGAGRRRGPVQIQGRIDIPGFGEGYLRGIMQEEIGADRDFDVALSSRGGR